MQHGAGAKVSAAIAAWALAVAQGQPAKAEPAYAGRTYIVDQRHPKASDQSPGTPEAPLKTIGQAARMVAPGDAVTIRGGVYRETVTVETDGTPARPIRFTADVAALVIVSGADPIVEWTKEAGPDNVFSAPWPHVFMGDSPGRSHPGDDYHALIGRAEQVFVQGYPLHQVLRREQLSRGSFYVDEAGKRLYVWSAQNADLTGLLAEASVREAVWDGKGRHIQMRGLRFRHAANRAQAAAARFGGHTLLEDCVFEQMNSIGAFFGGSSNEARRCVFQDNGQMGFSAYRAVNLLLTDCVVRRNNTKGWNRSWEAGGNKLVLCRGVVMERCQFLDNKGSGVWFDIGNEDCVVRNCLIADNEDAGIFYEISYGLHAHDNVIIGNGFAFTPGAWGAQAGISLSSSPDCVIERNLIVGNREGFNFREQPRLTDRIDSAAGAAPVWNHDEIIRCNVLAYNRDAQTWGWFDVLDERFFPPALQVPQPGYVRPAVKTTVDGVDVDEQGFPVNLTLEKMKLAMAGNVYAVADGQPMFLWGCSWRHHVAYNRPDEVRQALNLEQGSWCGPFVFADYLTRDFRVPADSPALRLKCYPRGNVPGVRLGVME